MYRLASSRLKPVPLKHHVRTVGPALAGNAQGAALPIGAVPKGLVPPAL
jgi:hypothetical protein